MTMLFTAVNCSAVSSSSTCLRTRVALCRLGLELSLLRHPLFRREFFHFFPYCLAGLLALPQVFLGDFPQLAFLVAGELQILSTTLAA